MTHTIWLMSPSSDDIAIRITRFKSFHQFGFQFNVYAHRSRRFRQIELWDCAHSTLRWITYCINKRQILSFITKFVCHVSVLTSIVSQYLGGNSNVNRAIFKANISMNFFLIALVIHINNTLHNEHSCFRSVDTFYEFLE